MNRILRPIASLFLLLAAAVTVNGANWTTDYAAAREQAKAENRPILLEFTGSDWCPPCQRLNAEVFSRSEFSAFADENLILVKLDFPRRTEQAPELAAQNRRLAEKYGIQGFPTVVILSPSGEEIGRTGYRRGGVASYIRHLESIIARGQS
jgi:protein disulfide-isomerase